jgi:hypothetical protein
MGGQGGGEAQGVADQKKVNNRSKGENSSNLVTLIQQQKWRQHVLDFSSNKQLLQSKEVSTNRRSILR